MQQTFVQSLRLDQTEANQKQGGQRKSEGFKEIFEGNNSAFGQLILSGKRQTRGKRERTPMDTKRNSLRAIVERSHVEG